MAKKKNLTWPGFMTPEEEANMKDFIVWLYEGFNKWGLDEENEDGDKYIDHVLYLAVRDVTRIIGECKSLHVSQEALKLLGDVKNFKKLEKARKDHPGETVEEHVKPAGEFFDDFAKRKTEGGKFTKADAAHWFKEAMIAVITNEEDARLTAKGWRDKRPRDAYEKVGITLTSITAQKKG